MIDITITKLSHKEKSLHIQNGYNSNSDNIKCSKNLSHILLVGIQSGTSFLENYLAVCIKLNVYVSCRQETSLLDIYPTEIKTYAHKKKKKLVFKSQSSFIHCSQILDTIQISIKLWMDK